MNKHTYITQDLIKEHIRYFGFGLIMGMMLQTIAPSTPHQAWLLRPVAVSVSRSSSASVSSAAQTSRQKRIALRIKRQMLVESAKKQGYRAYIVADASLHQAAPLANEVGSASLPSPSSKVSMGSTEFQAVSSSISSLSVASSLTSKVTPTVTIGFPAFTRSVFPVSKVPNWGNMHTPREWNRTYKEMTDADFVAIPSYDLKTLTTPMSSFTRDSSPGAIAAVTEKLFYSTRYFGEYDLDAGEWSAIHPGVDLKRPMGTPVGAIGGGRVLDVTRTQALGLHVQIEHRLQTGEIYVSIYGHMDTVVVNVGDTVTPGQIIGTVGMTGNTSAPHLHLQIDRGDGSATHTPYQPSTLPSSAEADTYVVNPITFIQAHHNDDK